MIGESSVVVKNGDPLVASVGAEVVMLDPRRGTYFGLGPTGSRIWELLEGPTAVADVCAALAAEYDVALEVCLRDTVAFLEQLVAADLVRAVP